MTNTNIRFDSNENNNKIEFTLPKFLEVVNL